ncbi:hypothetical protein WDZ92_17100 [Nostoc sp. NIES-2111]
MFIINQASRPVHVGLPAWVLLGSMAAQVAFAATGEDARTAALREDPPASTRVGSSQAMRILEMQDPGEWTLGTVLFGEGRGFGAEAVRRGPR